MYFWSKLSFDRAFALSTPVLFHPNFLYHCSQYDQG